MAKLGKYDFSFRSTVDYSESVCVEVEVYVSKNGEFYFSLNDEQVKMMSERGIDLSSSCNEKTRKHGTFRAKSLAELKKNFQAVLEEAVSSEVLEDKYVILYQIKTCCSYCMSEGEPVPNGDYVRREELGADRCVKWHEGTEWGCGSGWGFRVYAQVYHKQVFKFKSGRIKTVYGALGYAASEKLGEYGMRLNHFRLDALEISDIYGWSGGAAGFKDCQEIDYTEQNAKFFHDILIAVCKMNEQIKSFAREPERLQHFINSQLRLSL